MAEHQWFNLFLFLGILQGSLCTLPFSFQSTSSEDVREFICPGEGFYPGEVVCTGQYYYCSSGKPYPQTCPDSAVFDPMSLTCVPYEEASCMTTTSSTTVTTLAPFVCPSPDGLYPVPGTCGSDYNVCTDGSSSLGTCPMGELFDPITYECTPNNQTSCNIPFECPNSDGFYTYPGACAALYFICVSNVSYMQYCPSGSVFDPERLVCIAIENASCIPGPPVTQETTPPTSTTEELTTPSGFVCPSDGKFPYEGNCTVYWFCIGGEAIVIPCPEGLVYNPNTKTCDFPENGTSCITNLSEESQINFLSEARDNLIGPDPDFVCPGYGIWPHPVQCELYYTCYFTEPTYLWKCSGTLLFDLRYDGCNYPELTDCGDRTRPGSTISSSITTSTTTIPITTTSPFVCPSDGFFPLNPDACSSSYYTCVGGIPYLQTCPGNALFDPSVSACVSADQANCAY